jgi:uncharacterized membrane protein (Fun14 family)
MSLENISSAFFTAGSGAIVGFLIGYAIKKVMKIFVTIIGIFLGALMYFQSQQIIAVNWDKLQSVSESTLLVISNALSNTQQISAITANFK